MKTVVIGNEIQISNPNSDIRLIESVTRKSTALTRLKAFFSSLLHSVERRKLITQGLPKKVARKKICNCYKTYYECRNSLTSMMKDKIIFNLANDEYLLFALAKLKKGRNIIINYHIKNNDILPFENLQFIAVDTFVFDNADAKKTFDKKILENSKNFCCKTVLSNNFSLSEINSDLPTIAVAHRNQLQYANINCYALDGSCQILPLYTKLHSFILKVLRRIWFKLNIPFKHIWYSKEFKINIASKDSIIVFDSLLGLEIFSYIKRNAPCTKQHFWLWNTCTLSMKKISYVKKFAKVWSFDIGDVEKYDINYNHQFYGNYLSTTTTYNSKNGLLFIGRDKGRLSLLLKVAEFCKQNNIKYYFYIFGESKETNDPNIVFSNSFLTYTDVMRLIDNSAVLLDLVKVGQIGMTLRLLEGVFNSRKILTNNDSIIKSDLYNSNNIYLLNEENIEGLNLFVKTDIINSAVKEKYTFDDWIRNFR